MHYTPGNVAVRPGAKRSGRDQTTDDNGDALPLTGIDRRQNYPELQYAGAFVRIGTINRALLNDSSNLGRDP